MLKYELIKIWKNKFLIGAIITLAIVNLFLLWYFSSDYGNADHANKYKTMSQRLSQMSESEKLNYITTEYELNSKERRFITEIKEEIDTISGYQPFLEDIDNRAEVLQGVGIFRQNPSGFSYRNILATQKAFAGMNDVKINYTVSKGLVSATDFVTTDIIILLFMLTLSSIIIFSEKEKGLFALIKSTQNGRGKLAVSKILAIGISVFSACVFFYLGNLIYCEIAFGLGNLNNSLQSVSFFTQSTLKVNIFWYLIIFLLTKGIAFFTISVLVLLIAILSKSSITTYISFGTIFFVSALLYWGIPATSGFNWLKYVNVISIISTNNLFSRYLNLNLFSQPVSLISVTIMFAAILMILFIVAALAAFCHKRDMNAGSNPLYKTLQKLTFKKKSFGGLFTQEIYKIMVMNRGICILILFCLLQLFSYQNKSEYLSMPEYHYKNYMAVLSGELNQEKHEFINHEQAKFENAEDKIATIIQMTEEGSITKEQQAAMISPYQQTLEVLPVFEKVLERFEYVKNNQNTEFVYERGYYKLFGIYPNNDLINTLFCLIMLILCFSSVFAAEYKGGMDKVIKSAYKGRTFTIRKKVQSGTVLSLIICLISFIPELFYLDKQLGLSNITASAASLPEFSFLPDWISLLALIIIIYIIKLCATIGVMMIIFTISNTAKNYIIAMLLALLIFACPVILTGMNISIARQISILPVISLFAANTRTGLMIHSICFIILMSLSILSFYILKKEFCRTPK